jgi:hypothetical protein
MSTDCGRLFKTNVDRLWEVVKKQCQHILGGRQTPPSKYCERLLKPTPTDCGRLSNTNVDRLWEVVKHQCRQIVGGTQKPTLTEAFLSSSRIFNLVSIFLSFGIHQFSFSYGKLFKQLLNSTCVLYFSFLFALSPFSPSHTVIMIIALRVYMHY